jgi:uncharacterized protein involved in exopolysaccharide biosynthesis
VTPVPRVTPAAPPEPEPAPAPSTELVDWALVAGTVAFVWRAPRRHPWLAAAAVALAVGLAGLWCWGAPRGYRAEVKLLAQRNLVIPALGNPGRAVPRDADAPTRNAAELVLRRDGLLELVRATGLVEHGRTHRAPMQRARDAVLAAVFGPLTEEEQLDALVATLEKRLAVWTDEGVLTISVTWDDPGMARRIVDEAHARFLASRRAMELDPITQALEILERHAAELRGGVDEALEAARRASPRAAPDAPAPRRAGAPRDLVALRETIADRRRQLADQEDARQRTLAGLQAQLAERRAIYAPAHPLVRGTQQALEALTPEPAEVVALRGEVRALEERYLSASAADPTGPVARAPSVAAPQDVGADYARARLAFGVRKYEELLDRIESARIELDSARVAFDGRYAVVKPAQAPRRPVGPPAPLVLLAGAAGGVLLAFLGAAALDLARGPGPREPRLPAAVLSPAEPGRRAP